MVVKLSNLIKHLQQIKKTHGDDLKLFYSSDDEGNEYHEVIFTPVVGCMVGNKFGSYDNISFEKTDQEVNAIVIN